MSDINEVKLGDVGRLLKRYQPFLAVAIAAVLVMVILPGRSSNQGDDGSFDTTGGTGQLDDSQVAAGGTDTTVAGAPTDGGPAPAGGPADGPAGAPGAPGGPAPAGGPAAGGPLAAPAGAGANCDPATGRIRVPTRYAPPCKPEFSGGNGGNTYQGVSGDSITVVFYQPKVDPATDAALRAAGASNSPAEQAATFNAYVEYFNANYETYGRTVKVVVKAGSGDADDDAAGRADAIDIATRIKPFAVIGNTALNPFVLEIAARKITCICTTSQPQELYEGNAPYVGFTTLMSSTQGYIQRAEYIGKRLAGRNAVHAGTSLGTTGPVDLATKRREFGILYYETADNAYRSGVDFFERELQKYNIRLKVRLAYTGPPNLATTQEQSRPFISKLKSEGVTSVIFSGDPISPAIFTSEASKQQYFPEWIVVGSALTDTTLFGRTYDPLQWDKAFGISFLVLRGPEEQTDPFRTHQWFHGRTPTAANQYGVIYPGAFTLFTGIHMAGPDLNPTSFARGLFAYPPTGQGFVTSQTMSWGEHGIWPFTDFTAYDDVTEIWWDPNATGPDEVGNQGKGMYRYVDGGKRYLPGQHPTSDPRVFDPNGSPTILPERPANERGPDYPAPQR